MHVAIIHQNRFGRWEAVTSDKNRVSFMGPMLTGFDTREELESSIEFFAPGQYVLTDAEF